MVVQRLMRASMPAAGSLGAALAAASSQAGRAVPRQAGTLAALSLGALLLAGPRQAGTLAAVSLLLVAPRQVATLAARLRVVSLVALREARR